MHHDITRDNVAKQIYDRIICPTGDPQQDLITWMDITRRLGCVLAQWQRQPPAHPGYEAQSEALAEALLKAQDIMRCLARVA